MRLNMNVKIGIPQEDNAIDEYGVDLQYNRYLMEVEDVATRLVEEREKVKKKVAQIELKKKQGLKIKAKDSIWGFKPISMIEQAFALKL